MVSTRSFRPVDWLVALESAGVLSGWLPIEAFIEARLHFSDASGSTSEPVAGDGWIACGDPAVSFEPISSQRILNAIRTSAAAAAAILAETPSALDDYRAEIEGVRKIDLRTHGDRERVARILGRKASVEVVSSLTRYACRMRRAGICVAHNL